MPAGDGRAEVLARCDDDRGHEQHHNGVLAEQSLREILVVDALPRTEHFASVVEQHERHCSILLLRTSHGAGK